MKKKAENQWQDKTAAWIAEKMITVITMINRILQKQTQRLTGKQKKVMLFTFCLLGSTYFLYLLGSALFCQSTLHSHYGIVPVQKIAQPPPDTTVTPGKQNKTFTHQQKQKP